MPTADELKGRGVAEYMRGDYEQAAETFRAAATQYEEVGVADMVAEMRVNLGLALHSLGQHDAALEQMTQAHAVFVQMNDAHRTAQALGNMARVYAGQGNSEQAITNYHEAAAIFNELGDEENYGQTVLAIADLQLRGGQVMKAAATFEVGLDCIKNPNTRQKLMKKLLGLRNRMGGGGSSVPRDAGSSDQS